MIDEFSNLKKDFNKKFVKQGLVNDLDLGLFWGWIIENFNRKAPQEIDCIINGYHTRVRVKDESILVSSDGELLIKVYATNRLTVYVE